MAAVIRRWMPVLSLLLFVASCGRQPGLSSVRSMEPPRVPGATQSVDPAIAREPDRGNVLLSWLAWKETGWRLYFARSADGGSTWSDPVAVTPPGEPIHPHGESSPRLIAGRGGRVALVWSTSREIPGREWPASDLRFSRSLDGGRTWDPPRTLNDDSTAAPGSHSFHGATLGGESTLVVAWLDERRTRGSAPPDSEGADDASLYAARSDDFGTTWSANAPFSDRVCPCCRVELAFDGDRLLAAWRRHFPGQIRDIVVAELGSLPRRVRADDWKISGCPHSGPALSVDPGGTRHIAWYTGAAGRAGVYYQRWTGGLADSSVSPIPLTSGRKASTAHVSLAWSPTLGSVVAFDKDSSGSAAITLASIDPKRPGISRMGRIPGSEGGIYPQVATLDRTREVIVAWSAGEGARQSIRLAKARFGR